MENEIIVKYIEQENRSVALNNNKVIGECDFEIKNNKIVITHTIVSEEYGGRGIAKRLVLAIIDEARKENKNYKNGKAPVIAYTMAYLHYITFEDLPLLEIWVKQGLSDKLKEALDMIAEMMFKQLSDIANFEGTTILSISKRKGIFSDITQNVSGDTLYTLRSLALG